MGNAQGRKERISGGSSLLVPPGAESSGAASDIYGAGSGRTGCSGSDTGEPGFERGGMGGLEFSDSSDPEERSVSKYDPRSQ